LRHFQLIYAIRCPISMKRCIYIFLFFSVAMTSCSEDEPRKAADRPFVPGDVAVGIKPEVEIGQVFNLMNEKMVTIDMMSGFFTYSLLPPDSVDYINNQLAGKSYFNQRGWSDQRSFIADSQIKLTTFFFDMDLAAQTDWLETMEKLQLKDLHGETKNLLIKVAPGTEKAWIRFFESHPFVTWAHLNEYVEITHN
jgi:hypothetical protein